MSHPFRALARPALAALAEALAAGRLPWPPHAGSLTGLVPEDHAQATTAALRALAADGVAPRHAASTLRLLVEERDAAQRMSDRVQLVWSPPELDAVDARDTAVVVQEMFRRAERSVMIATFALDERKKAEVLFGALASRMDADPTLHVRIFANIHRVHGDDTPATTLAREFATRMRTQVWPGRRQPEVYYDPRSLEVDAPKRAVLHAKALVVDGRWTLLTSANLTEAAHERNIEAGLLVDDRALAARVTLQLDRLVAAGALRRLL